MPPRVTVTGLNSAFFGEAGVECSSLANKAVESLDGAFCGGMGLEDGEGMALRASVGVFGDLYVLQEVPCGALRRISMT